MRHLWEIIDFPRVMRRRMRFGELSRAPLRLLRLELRGKSVECDWVARPLDIWDASLRRPIRDRNEALQALVDAMTMRELLFCELPSVESAVLRVFRKSAFDTPDLIILGTVNRDNPEVPRVESVVMRAKLYGFCFYLDGVWLRPLEVEQRAEEFIT